MSPRRFLVGPQLDGSPSWDPTPTLFIASRGTNKGKIVGQKAPFKLKDIWALRVRLQMVAAPTCTEAGMLATFAMLRGAGAEDWLAAQGMPHWVLR